MIHVYIDSSEAKNLMGSMLVNSQNIAKILGEYARKRTKESIKESFKLQQRPDGTPWKKSKLSQTDPTGSPRKTLLRSTELYQDMQDDANYQVYGDILEVSTSVTSEKGFLYGAYHNSEVKGNWQFAGLNDKNLNALQEDIIEFILGKR
jgi:hypothetical protein